MPTDIANSPMMDPTTDPQVHAALRRLPPLIAGMIRRYAVTSSVSMRAAESAGPYSPPDFRSSIVAKMLSMASAYTGYCGVTHTSFMLLDDRGAAYPVWHDRIGGWICRKATAFVPASASYEDVIAFAEAVVKAKTQADNWAQARELLKDPTVMAQFEAYRRTLHNDTDTDTDTDTDGATPALPAPAPTPATDGTN